MNTDLEKHLMPLVQRPPLVMVRGEGSYLWDGAGRRYLDLVQGWAVNALGHAPPELLEALTRQAAELITPSPAYHNEPAQRLAERLTALSGMDAVCFTNSGAEATEVAIKIARKWGRLHRHGAFEVVTTVGAFHGRTLAAMAASGKPGWDQLFPPYPRGFVRVAFGEAEAVRAAIGPTTAAILVEPIQGEAGVVVPPDGYLAELREVADRAGILLMVDEVQTGIGRTGALFAHGRDAVLPDVMTLGKGLGGGMPMGAVLVANTANCLAVGEQGGTYHGNPLACTAALAVLEVVARPDFLAVVSERGAELSAALGRIADELDGARVRGRGLLWALHLDSPRAVELRDAALAAGMLVNAAQPDVLRLMPSLRITSGEIAQAEAILTRVARAGDRDLDRDRHRDVHLDSPAGHRSVTRTSRGQA